VSRRLARPVDLSDGVIRLEPLAARPVPDFESLVDDPDVVRFTRVPADPGEGFVAAWLGGYERGWDDESKAGFAVVGAESGEFLGFVGFIRFDWDAQESEIGYVIAPAARGRGIAGRAIQLTSRWGFDDLGLERIEAWIDVGNEASQRVAERAGYRREGVRRWSAFKEGKRVDMAIYSLLPGELP
jgi:RimJ/RimL family protein N-acetyltransferase